MRRRTLAVAITGGIGSGKSEVASVFGEMGARVVSADREAKAVLASARDVRRRIVRLLGEKCYSPAGRVNRSFIAERIFANPSLRRRVNAIVHPEVIRRVRAIITLERKKAKRRLVVVEAALIYEAGMEKMFDAVIVVDAPLGVRIGRIRRRDGIPKSDAVARIRAQGQARRNAARADFVISNRGDRRTLRKTARFLCTLLSGLADIS